MNPLGLHLPDRDVLEAAELEAVRRLRPAVLLAMAYEADKGQAAQVNALVAELGHADLLVRCWGPAIPQQPPEAWAAACAARLARYSAPRLHLIPANEWNLAAEGGHEDYGRHAVWFRRFAAAYRALRPGDVLHLPAPWAGWVGEQEARALEAWRALQAAGVLELYDAVDVHAYGAGFDLWRRCRDLLGRRPWITEWNAVPAADVAAALREPDGPLGAVYFTLRWVSYTPGQEWRPEDRFSLLRYPELEAEFARAAEPAPEEESMSEQALVGWLAARARAAGLPPELVVGCAIAESGLRVDARRPPDPAQDAAYWPDVSFGLFQQTIRWSDEYLGWCAEHGHPPAELPGPDVIAYIGAMYTDREHALAVALPKLAAGLQATGNVLDALCHYNAPAIPPSQNPNRANYAAGLARARTILAGQPPAPSADQRLERAVQAGLGRVGDPYVWDGEQPGGFDCSGFVSWMFRQVGVELPSFTDAIADATDPIDSPARGDLVLYRYQDSGQPGVRYPHMGVWLGDGTVLESRWPNGVGVYAPLQRPMEYRRVRLPAEPPAEPPLAPPGRAAELERELAETRAWIDMVLHQLTVVCADALAVARKRRRWGEVRAVEQELRRHAPGS